MNNCKKIYIPIFKPILIAFYKQIQKDHNKLYKAVLKLKKLEYKN